MALKRPIKIGKYDVVDLLGRGGMGVVYKATDPLLGRSVAIKMMTMVDYVENPEMLQRFYREAQSTGNLHHRNIVTVYELGDQEGSPYLVMEYLEGDTLDALIHNRQPLTILDRVDYIVEVCDGLTYAHQRSVVHRDIKPGNIMVLKDGGVKIVDFGIAHIGNRTVTRTGQLLGSLPYMSPEQISGKQVDGRTDIFSLGVVFYQLLTSHLPFEGETPASTLLKIMHDPPRSLSEFGETFPAELDGILARALAKDREERYATAQDFAFDLLQVRGRIQQELVEEQLNEAESLLLHGELLKTREKLSQILKLDRHNTRAVELSRIAQQRIQQQELGQRVGEFRRQAEEAYEKQRFVDALDLVQKALSLHATDPDLQRLRGSIQQAKTRADQLKRTVQRAQSALEQGELDSAKQAIEEALAVAPHDSAVKSLNEQIQQEWAQRAQRLQIQSLMEEARKEIAARNFTLALQVLRSAEAIDPSAPHLKALIDAAQAAREQEQRRKALEALKHEIESDLDHDDFQVACAKAQAALQQFPDDRGLQKLAELAENQRAQAERKYFIDEQVSQARKLLEIGRTEDALEILHSAQDKVGGDPHLESLLSVVRETLERQRAEARKAEYLRRAKDLLRRKDYEQCIRTLDAAQDALGKNAEIDDLRQFTLEQWSAEKRRQSAEMAAEKARTLINDHDYEGAVSVLETALSETPDEELRIVLVQARHAAADHRKRLHDVVANAESMIQGQKPIEALKYLRAQPASFSRDHQFLELVKKAEQQAERLQTIEREIEKARLHLGRDDYDRARAVLEECVRAHGRIPELNKLIAEIEERQTQLAAETLQSALAEARSLMTAGKPDEALDHLALVQTIITMVPPKLSASYRALQQDAATAKARNYKLEVEHLLAEGDHEHAAATLERAQAEYPQNRDLHLLRKTLDQAATRRIEAQKRLSRAEQLFRDGQWQEGADTCLNAAPSSARDPVIRKAILRTLEQAAKGCVESDWRASELLLQCITQLSPDASLPPAVVDKIKQGKREEAVAQYLEEAEEFRSQGNVDEALRRTEAGLATYPDEGRLLEMQQRLRDALRLAEERARADREQRKKQAFFVDLRRRLARERSPGARIGLLEEALRQYPGEGEIVAELANAQRLESESNSLVEKAKAYEQAHRYDEAIATWQSVRDLGIERPDLQSSVTRLNRLREEARSAIKSAWLKAVRDAINAFHFEAASSFLTDAQREFPADKEIADALTAHSVAVRKREQDLLGISEAQKLFRSGQWQHGAESIGQCLKSSAADPVVASGAFAALLEAVQAAVGRDVRSAEMLLDRAAGLKPDSPEITNLRTLVQKHSLEEIVKERLAGAQAVADRGETEHALRDINQALSEFPREPRLLTRKQELEREIEIEQEAREKENRLIEILEAAQELRADGNLKGALQKIEEGLIAFPGHSQFVEMKGSVENSLREIETRKPEEEQRQRAIEAERHRKEDEKRRHEQQRKLQEDEKRKAEKKAAAQSEPARLETPAGKKKAPDGNKGKTVSPFPKTQKGGHPSPDYETQVWRGSALPAEVTRPREQAPRAVQQVPSARAGEQKGLNAGKAAGQKSATKFYVVAACLTVAAILLPVLWTMTRKSPVIKTIPLQVLTNPPGAAVHVKGTDQQCVTTRCVLNLAPGSYQLQVELPGYQALNREVSVSAESSNPIVIGLTPVPSIAPGNTASQPEQNARLELRDGKPGSEVLIDNQAKGKINRRGTFATELSAGNHQVRWTSRNQASGNVQRDFAAGGQVQLSGADLNEAKTPPVVASGNPEQIDWQKVKDSGAASDVEQFLQKYPSGAFSGAAQAKLEDLYWNSAVGGNSAASYNQYLEKFPQGKHAQQAQTQIAGLEWRAVENSNDIAALETFLKKHPSGSDHDKALSRIDDLSWQKVKQNDASSLRSYLQSFPSGRHDTEANKKIEELSAATPVAPATKAPPAAPVVSDEKSAILDVVSRYKRAYEAKDIQSLQQIWPSMTSQQTRGVGDFFAHASELSLEVRVLGTPTIDGDRASATFEQSLRYMVNGKSRKDVARVVMNLKRAAPGVWHIDSIR